MLLCTHLLCSCSTQHLIHEISLSFPTLASIIPVSPHHSHASVRSRCLPVWFACPADTTSFHLAECLVNRETHCAQSSNLFRSSCVRCVRMYVCCSPTAAHDARNACAQNACSITALTCESTQVATLSWPCQQQAHIHSLHK